MAPCLSYLVRIAFEIADGGVDLCYGDLHPCLAKRIGEVFFAKDRIADDSLDLYSLLTLDPRFAVVNLLECQGAVAIKSQ